MRAAEAILLYGAEVCADAFRFKKYRLRMDGAQRRSARRISSAYRTVSGPADQVIAGIVPIHLLAQERKRIYERKAETPTREEREETIFL